MASTSGPFSRAGVWGTLALLSMLLCSQTDVVWADGDDQCSNNVCRSPSAYAPAHFILVHGMAGGAWFWFETIPFLERYGFKATTVDLTANGISKAIPDDVTTLAQYAKPLTDAIENVRGPVIVVGHSLSGGLAAYVSELYSTKISKAIYLSSIMPTYSQSMFGSFPPTTIPYLLKNNFLALNFNRGSATPSSASVNCKTLDQFYMSETPDKYVSLFETLCTVNPFVPGTEVLSLTPAKYGTVKRYYIRTGRDKTIVPADQDAIIAANPPRKVFCMKNGDHAVFLSAPIELALILMCISGQ